MASSTEHCHLYCSARKKRQLSWFVTGFYTVCVIYCIFTVSEAASSQLTTNNHDYQKAEMNHTDNKTQTRLNENDDSKTIRIQNDDPKTTTNQNKDPKPSSNQNDDSETITNQDDDPDTRTNQKDDTETITNQDDDPDTRTNQKDDPKTTTNQNDDSKTRTEQNDDLDETPKQNDDPQTTDHFGQMLAADQEGTVNSSKLVFKSIDDYYCFEKLCICRILTADCSGHNGSLTFIPRFQQRKYKKMILRVNFSFNDLRSIPTADFLRNASNMSSLDLSHNHLAYIAPGAFRVMINLQTLILDSNDLTYQAITPVFPLPTLINLRLRSLGLGPIPVDFFHPGSVPELRTLDLSNNKLGTLDLSALSSLTKLLKLFAKSCELTNAAVISAKMPSLKELKLNNNTLIHLPQSCDEHGETLFPRLEKLWMHLNVLNSLQGKYCLPSLYLLDLSATRITHFTTDMFSDRKFPSLTSLYLYSIQPIMKIQDFAFRHPRLEELVMAYCILSTNVVSPQAFAGCPQLANLSLSHAQVADIPEEKFSMLFGSIPNLQVFLLQSAGIRSITTKTFNQLTKLRKLYLDRNKLTDLPDGAFDDLVNLTELILSDNELKTIGENAFSPQTLQRLTKLDLSGNKFTCDCGVLWFRKLYLSWPWLFKNSYGVYSCHSGDSRYTLSQLVLPAQACYFSQATYKFIIAVITMIVIVFTVITVVFQFRWHIRLLMYETFRGDGHARRRRLRENHFAFDVFVSYAKNDLPWVGQHLIPELEGNLGLRLCIHERDFIIGNNIVDNIAECVESSKKVLMVFSRSFVTSHWCQFELNYCLNHVMEHDDALVVTCIGDLTTMEPTGAMMAVLKTTTYIQWQESAEARAAFWGRLKLALGEILQDEFV